MSDPLLEGIIAAAGNRPLDGRPLTRYKYRHEIADHTILFFAKISALKIPGALADIKFEESSFLRTSTDPSDIITFSTSLGLKTLEMILESLPEAKLIRDTLSLEEDFSGIRRRTWAELQWRTPEKPD